MMKILFLILMFCTGVVLSTAHIGINDWQLSAVLIFVALSYVLGRITGMKDSVS